MLAYASLTYKPYSIAGQAMAAQWWKATAAPKESQEAYLGRQPLPLTQSNGRRQLPGQTTESPDGLQNSSEAAVPQSWVAMRSDQGERIQRLRHDDGTHVSLAGPSHFPLSRI